MKPTVDRVLWLDCLGGLFVGCVVLSICRLLSQWENLPLSVVMMMGAANLCYGCYSLFVTTRRPRPREYVSALAMANMIWFVVCSVVLIGWWDQITPPGIVHVAGEGIYVGALGFTEWKLRDRLSAPKL